jgi:hypothetical protein
MPDLLSVIVVVVLLGALAAAARGLYAAWRRVMTEAATLQIWRGMERRGLAPEDAAGHERALAIAARRCALCSSLDECEHWLAGERHDPSAFCPNSMFMENLQREKRRAKKVAA